MLAGSKGRERIGDVFVSLCHELSKVESILNLNLTHSEKRNDSNGIVSMKFILILHLQN